MTKKEEIAFIKKHAPILWLQDNESFLPEDCRVMEDIAKIGTSNANMKSFKIDEIGSLKKSEKYYVDIPEIDFPGFGMNSAYQGTQVGPDGLADFVRLKYGNNPFLNPRARPVALRYHARMSRIRLEKKADEESRAIGKFDQNIFGNYRVVQYYFFYVFNDSWNKHVSDWDGTLELFIKEDESRAFAIFYMHHVSWLVKFGSQPQPLKKWLADWQDVETKKRMGWCFQYDGHPFIFVAEGAHGAYPTPGFSIHGAKIFNKKIIGQTDYRQIGRLCILPENDQLNKDALIKILKEAKIDARKAQFLSWGDPIVLDGQSWLKYKGLWGTRSDYAGWGGSPGPSRKKCWRMDQRRVKRELAKALKGNYTGVWPYKILLNWHGWR